ncbi:MAG: flagellar basal body-associated FliL family protein [Pseudobdellovibrionaceae bacterium]|nr:flagellar basal body-associated FliL family protein [Pseudobdellovibrionaceae bacterium]
MGNQNNPDHLEENVDESIDDAAIAELEQWLREENPQSLKEIEELGIEKIESIVEDDTILQDKNLSPWERIKHAADDWLVKSKIYLQNQLISLYYFLLIWIKKQVSNCISITTKWAGILASNFKKLSLITKLALILAMGILISLPVATYKLIQYLNRIETLNFTPNLADYAQIIIPLEKPIKYENFFRTKRKPPNLFLLKKIVTNLLPESTHSKPMIAAEILVEAQNPQALLTIKNNEGYFRDLIMTFSQSWSYHDLATTEGKTKYLNALREEIQKHIPNGRIIRLYFKTIILKPGD